MTLYQIRFPRYYNLKKLKILYTNFPKHSSAKHSSKGNVRGTIDTSVVKT